MRNPMKPDAEWMAGVYRLRFASAVEATAFRTRFATCPLWRLMTDGIGETDVVVLAIERVAQHHGDFSQAGNTLVAHPEYVGAVDVLFRRDDGLLDLFPDADPPTGYAEYPPCGSDCITCPTYGSPCRGCPAVFPYGTSDSD